MKKRGLIAALLLLFGAGALLLVQRGLVTAEITPRPLLYLLADTQRELERIPLELTRVSEQEENRLGQELARNYGLTPAVHKDPDARRIANYISNVGLRLASHTSRRGIQYRFFYMDERHFVNAGALPGGQIVIGRGLLELVETEDELAGILAHEIAHVDKLHSIERLQYEMKSKQLGLRGLYRLAEFGVVLYKAGYSKEQEEEADREGLALAVAAGYAPEAAVEIQRRFERLYGERSRPATSPLDEVLRIPLQSIGEYFRSHPPARERIATLDKEIVARSYATGRPQKPFAIRAIFLAEQAAELDKRGLFDRAIAVYQDALKSESGNLRALEGLARTHWRAGNASETHSAALQRLQKNADSLEVWRLLASSLAVVNRSASPGEFDKALQDISIPYPLGNSVQIERLGLRIFAGESWERIGPQYSAVPGLASSSQGAELRLRMSWWLCRSGNLSEAENQLNLAWQMFPQQSSANQALAWVQSELGRQADALENMNRSRRGPLTGDDLALEAVILWRTDRKDEAKAAFRRAAEEDPVWMNPRWAENNYSGATSAVIGKLQAEEIARRKLVELRSGRTPAPR